MDPIEDLISLEKITAIFQQQKQHQYAVANEPIAFRKQKLRKLKLALEKTYRKEIQDALYNDFKKNPQETDLSEIYPVTGEIKHTLRNLSHWTGRNSVGTPLAFLGASSRIKQEPKGVCLIISPWNFPFNLSFGPLVSAIAAGNTVMLKPSEFTPHSSRLIKKIIADLFDENEVTVIEGAVQTSTDLLSLPFNHIFFTGSPAVGKVVMTAAAKHLASVTLELGGKSPTIVDETANIDLAAKRITWGKFINSGQVCIAPDHVYVHESKKDALVHAFQKYLTAFYSDDPQHSTAFTQIVNQKNTARLQNLIDDAVAKGGKVVYGGTCKVAESYIQPTLITDITANATIMEQEIFGPVLPILTYQNIDSLIALLNAREKPLALYVYSKSASNTRLIIDKTRAGGSCINNNDLQFFNNNLPFGGANNSGIGKSHGFFGFQEFSNARGIYKQNLPGALDFLMPPYNNLKKKMIDLTIKWF